MRAFLLTVMIVHVLGSSAESFRLGLKLNDLLAEVRGQAFVRLTLLTVVS